ncbi:TIGR03084 family metal-binding protein [Actinomadura opuntiae]|uniref:TIGR03084 family metal-binding protein n=1 Tax=Actinomadura sp. OS1-43 TaxID=604315 RepID=UPI00255AF6BA|nr:TIGR03084 family metal-binding protein [Actinomadura sp. OS1-43]MDL4820974.1 TIGR03084 family metal-binding protein [Actinomadura sp. OS1-43]
MPDLHSLLADLAAEGDSLDALVAPLPAARWADPTPAEGWTVAHQIAHLAWTDVAAFTAATDAAAFARLVDDAVTEPGYIDARAEAGAAEDPAVLLGTWRDARTRLADALAALPAGARLPWFGPPMSVPSMATARLMETWAHGEDIADALGVRREPTARLRHVAHIGVRARDFAFRNRGMEPPAEEFRVELTGPDGDKWTWGPDGAAQTVTAPALDFCLLVTRRRHRADLAVVATGADADRWLDVAQAFAGPPGEGRPPTTG